MRILFVHQNFPGQFKHLMPALAADPANEVVVFTMNALDVPLAKRVVRYTAARATTKGAHRWVSDVEAKLIRGEAALNAAKALHAEGFIPDVIIAHPGWGESLFLKEVWPSSKLGIYCEFYYHAQGADVGFDPEFPVDTIENACRMQLKNVNNLLHFQQADAGISPTAYQRSVFPEPFRSRITTVHDGIDTEQIAPNASVRLTLNGQMSISRADEIITFVNRDLEPYRGYHRFMRALPKLLRLRPNARILIVGGNDVSYGARPPSGQTWKQVFLDEVRDQVDLTRIHFLGRVPYDVFLCLLQASRVHVYLTYPFVLSWSLLEAMSCGCAIVASDTAPVREAIEDGYTGRLVDFFDADGLAAAIASLSDAPAERARLGANARRFAQENYDLHQVCLPRQLAWVRELAAGSAL